MKRLASGAHGMEVAVRIFMSLDDGYKGRKRWSKAFLHQSVNIPMQHQACDRRQG